VREALDDRWFTALDMFGAAGTVRRGGLILAEIVAGYPVVFLVSVLTLRAGSRPWARGLSTSRLTMSRWPLTLRSCTREDAWKKNWQKSMFQAR
jgi:hypothetical protein